MGAHIVSCDHLGHAAYKKGTSCYDQMVLYFGQGILNEDGEVDRKKLGPLVFSNKVISLSIVFDKRSSSKFIVRSI